MTSLLTRLVIAVVISSTLIQVIPACSVREWRNHTMEEILYKADIVVQGKELGRFEVTIPTGPFDNRTDSNFEVYCVLKNDNPLKPIPERIVVEEVFPRNTCSGTKVEANTDVIVALQRRGDNFIWHEINVTPNGAAFKATPGNLKKATSVCKLGSPTPPPGRDPFMMPTCPAPGPVPPKRCIYFDEKGNIREGKGPYTAASVTAVVMFTIIGIFLN